ncbi:MAG: GIY-YIG nuclease family protein [Micavibrio sp.]
MSDLDELYDELSDLHVAKKEGSGRTAREERIIAGFEDIERFFEQHGRLPLHGEDKDIFERLYAVRLDKIRGSEECRLLLLDLDKHGLLGDAAAISGSADNELDDETLLEELEGIIKSDITNLTHVRPRAEINAAEEIANRTPCNDFQKFKPLFDAVSEEIAKGIRQSLQIRKDAGFLKSRIKVGDFFILYGQMVYVAEIGEPIKGSNEAMDARLRVIYSNGTESNLLLDSLRRGLYKDEASRIVTEPSAGPLFSGEFEDGDVETGTIYVLRSDSDYPFIKENREFIHKIGVTGGDIKKRLGNPKVSSTYLMADVEIVATYELSNINPVKLENLIHRFFKPAQLNIEIKDRLGNPIDPREWFLVPLFVIDQAIEHIKNGTIINYIYDQQAACLVRQQGH